ncbi:MAG: hypothetical protein ACOYL6_15225 [Bacteriovoracaceae bacterium]
MKKLFLAFLALNSISSFACDGLTGTNLEKKMTQELKLDLGALSYGKGNDGPMFKVKKAEISSLEHVREDILSYAVKLDLVGAVDPTLKKEVFGVLEYNLSDCTLNQMNLGSTEQTLKF